MLLLDGILNHLIQIKPSTQNSSDFLQLKTAKDSDILWYILHIPFPIQNITISLRSLFSFSCLLLKSDIHLSKNNMSLKNIIQIPKHFSYQLMMLLIYLDGHILKLQLRKPRKSRVTPNKKPQK